MPRKISVLGFLFSFLTMSLTALGQDPPSFNKDARFIPELGAVVWIVSGGDYSGLNLGQISFHRYDTYLRATYSHVDFSRANLSGSDFSGASFRDSLFCGADLSYAKMGAMNTPFLGDDNIVRRNLDSLRGSDFTDALVQGVTDWTTTSRILAHTRRDANGKFMLRDCRLALVDVTNEDFQQLDFSGCDLTNCHILTWVPPLGALPIEERVDRPRYILDDAVIRNTGVSFTDRVLEFSDFQRTRDYKAGVLYGLMWTRRLYGFPHTQYVKERALNRWRSSRPESGEFQFHESSQRRLDWDLSNLVLVNCVFDHCDLTNLKLTNSYLVNCEFIDCTNIPISEFYGTMNLRRNSMDKIRFYFSRAFEEAATDELIESLRLIPTRPIPIANFDETYHVPLERYGKVFKAYCSTINVSASAVEALKIEENDNE